MVRYLASRLVWLVPTLLGIAFLTSQLLYLVPGDPAQVILGDMASPEQIAALRSELNLDRGPIVRYVDYVANAVRGDLGFSYQSRRTVWTEIATAFPPTFQLALAAWFIASVVGSILGVVAAARAHTWIDSLLTAGAVVGLSMPVFWLGILLIYVAAILLNWLPTGGTGTWQHFVLPAVTLAAPTTGIIARFVRDGMLDALQEDYVRTAAAKGLWPRQVLFKHALRNAILPAITMMGVQMGQLLSGSVLTELIFSWPGMGRLLVNAIAYRDLLLVQGIVLVFATVFVLVNLLVDIVYGLINPRVLYA